MDRYTIVRIVCSKIQVDSQNKLLNALEKEGDNLNEIPFFQLLEEVQGKAHREVNAQMENLCARAIEYLYPQLNQISSNANTALISTEDFEKRRRLKLIALGSCLILSLFLFFYTIFFGITKRPNLVSKNTTSSSEAVFEKNGAEKNLQIEKLEKNLSESNIEILNLKNSLSDAEKFQKENEKLLTLKNEALESSLKMTESKLELAQIEFSEKEELLKTIVIAQRAIISKKNIEANQKIYEDAASKIKLLYQKK
jgi:hypothetical protein